MHIQVIKFFIISITLISSVFAYMRQHIEVVGSSTVFPFSTVVAETFGKKTTFSTPKVESTGSGGGIKLFCKGIGLRTPDITNSSRRIKVGELKNCHKNNVRDITEILIGYDGIVIANARRSASFELTLRDLYLALAAQVPASIIGGAEDEMIANPFHYWDEINKNLAHYKIKVLGPPPTSGTRDALQELALEGGCKTFKVIKAMKKKNKSRYKALCHTIREDGHYVETGENDNLIIAKLANDAKIFGIFGFSFLDQNSDKVKATSVNGRAATFENIADSTYPISRPLYMYVKNAHRNRIPGLNEFINEMVSEYTIGEEGYLIDRGLIPAPEYLRKKIAMDAKNKVVLEKL